MKYYLKKYVSVCKTHEKIYLFLGNKNDSFLSFKKNIINVDKINELIFKGIKIKDINNLEIYKKIYDKGFMFKQENIRAKTFINRNELFLNYLYEDLEKEDIDKTKQTEILIYGAGAGGSTLIYLLAQFGFKNITVIDFDEVEISDVYRTVTFFKEDISKSKVSVLKKNIKKNFSIDIKTFENAYSEKNEIEAMINTINPDFIINVCDPRPSFKLDLNSLCFKYKIPYISAAYSYDIVSIGPIYVPTVTNCENSFDFLIQKFYGEDFSYKNIEKMFTSELIHPSNSFNINLLASLTYKEILFFLLGKFDNCQTIGQRIYFNPLSYKIFSERAFCKEDCKICK